jgi:hypothetical protein
MVKKTLEHNIIGHIDTPLPPIPDTFNFIYLNNYKTITVP